MKAVVCTVPASQVHMLSWHTQHLSRPQEMLALHNHRTVHPCLCISNLYGGSILGPWRQGSMDPGISSLFFTSIARANNGHLFTLGQV
jgi:hypothetical protein